jgi:hypothetical protein
MPELWIPYGSVETLITIQAENLGVVSEPSLDGSSVDTERVNELARSSSKVFICDSTPATIEILKKMVPNVGDAQSFFAAAPKRIEIGVPELKGKITTLPPPLAQGEGNDPVFASELIGNGTKLFVGSAKPDPLFGILDSKVQACLNWVTRSRGIAASARKGMEPSAFQKTEAYEAMESLGGRIPESRFLTVVPRGGKPRTVMEDAPFDAVKNAFAKTQMPPARGIVIGAGGRGYDDSLSSAIRSVWNVIEGVRKTGSVLLIAECSEGMGSTALEMLVTGRMAGEGERRREKYVDGIEEVFYLNKLKAEYDVLLLSGLPETYARSKLGLTTAKGSGEAVGRILNKVGRTGKLNVVPRASECIVEPA